MCNKHNCNCKGGCGKNNSCGCAITLPTECVKWTHKQTELYKEGENLDNILRNIETLLLEATGGDTTVHDLIFKNKGGGHQVYIDQNPQNTFNFRTIVAGQDVEVNTIGDTIEISATIRKVLWENIEGEITDNPELYDKIEEKVNETVKVEGAGYLIGGGDLSTDRTIDLSQTSKTKLDNGDTAFSWGDHSSIGYATQIWVQSQGYLTSLPDLSIYALKTTRIEGAGELMGGGNLSANRTIDLSPTAKTKLDNGQTAFSWGNHSTAGYATQTWVNSQGFISTLPDLSIYALKTTTITGTGYLQGGGNLSANRTITLTKLTEDKIEEGHEAHSWGDHNTQGYITEAPQDGGIYGRSNNVWVEIEGSRATVETTEEHKLSASLPFDKALFDVCPSVPFNYIDWELTWIEDDKLIKLTTKDITDLSLSTMLAPGGCTRIIGVNNETSPITIPMGAKLILYY